MEGAMTVELRAAHADFLNTTYMDVVLFLRPEDQIMDLITKYQIVKKFIVCKRFVEEGGRCPEIAAFQDIVSGLPSPMAAEQFHPNMYSNMIQKVDTCSDFSVVRTCTKIFRDSMENLYGPAAKEYIQKLKSGPSTQGLLRLMPDLFLRPPQLAWGTAGLLNNSIWFGVRVGAEGDLSAIPPDVQEAISSLCERITSVVESKWAEFHLSDIREDPRPSQATDQRENYAWNPCCIL
jgi:hypothetical protein